MNGKIRGVRVWAWMFDFGLSRWAASSENGLWAHSGQQKPSPEAKSTQAVMLTLGDYRKLKKAAKGKL